MNRLLIIDGHALAFRAYFAFAASNLTNSITGLPSGAVFGFWRMLFKLLQDQKFSHIAFTFDPGTRLHRNDMYEPYKAHRKPMPEDLKPQLKEIYTMIDALEFPMYKMDGIEADDIIGSLCKKFADDFDEIVILSSDKDLYQVLTENVHMLRGKRGVSEFERIDPVWVEQNIGITKEQVTDYMALVGDASDNIPGVKGIGEKGASTLIKEYGSLENIYKNLDKLKNKGMIDKLANDKENAYLSRKLATIVTDLELDIKKSDLVVPNYLEPAKVQFFKTEGYNVLHKDLAKKAGITLEDTAVSPSAKESQTGVVSYPDTLVETRPKNEKRKYIRIKSTEELKKILASLDLKKILSIDTETTSTDPMLAELLGISFCQEPDNAYYIALAHPDSIFSHTLPQVEEVLKLFKPILENLNVGKIGQNIKYDLLVFKNFNVDLKGIVFDTMIASYILNPGERRHNMDDMAIDYLNYKTITYEELVGSGKKKQNLYDVDPELVSDYACEDADITYQLYKVLDKKIIENDERQIFTDLEMPLIPVLADMEYTGVLIKKEYFASLSSIFEIKIKEHEKNIHFYAGRTFNVNSTKELQVVLFEDLRLPAEKKTQTGFSTDHSVLESLQGNHPIIDDLLAIRKFSKLKSTYSDSLPTLINPKTGRIHTSYNQTIAATGRLSSTNPNLQNIPIKDEVGRLLRKGFLATPGFELLSLDYSQIELRIMAHFSKDERMISAYKLGEDIHRKTAAGLYGVAEITVSPEMRNRAKIVNFSVIYGVTSFGLSNNLKVSRKEAKEFIERYFLQYKGVETYMAEIVEFCKTHGYVETMMGRRRYLPDINAKNKMAQEAAKRVAINSPIQGTSADMVKLAMINIHNLIKKEKYKSRIILQVHDELVFEVETSEKDSFYKMAKKAMETALTLSVPIVVEGKFGTNWDEAH